MKYTTVIILLLVVTSCKTENWAVKKINEIDYRHPAITQDFCGTKYAPKINPAKPILIKGDTTYGEPEISEGGSSTSSDTNSYVQSDTVIMRITTHTRDTLRVKIPTYIHDTLLIRDTVVNTGELQACETKLRTAENDKTQIQTKLDNNKKWVLWLTIGIIAIVVAIVVYIIIKVKS